MVDQSILSLERLVTDGAVDVIRNAAKFLLFLRAFLRGLMDPLCFFHLQRSLQPLLPFLLPPVMQQSHMTTIDGPSQKPLLSFEASWSG